MGTEMIAAIAAKLTEEFGEGCTVYQNEAQEEPETPCFFIELGHLLEKRILGRRYQRQYAFDVMYVPETPGNRHELHQTGETLFSILERITACGVELEGTEMSYDVNDGVLHFHLNYHATVEKTTEAAASMEDVTVVGRTGQSG